ncbi:MAG TPA: hypothetical protein PLV56_01045 [Synergistales bacterium]|nr:hypothetical protein [Synergistales bacterium]
MHLNGVDPVDDGVTRLLWTGGWDSTFRLLYLVLIRSEPVQPYYIIDPGRRTFMLEMKARCRIQEQVYEMFPEKAELIRPSILFYKGDIRPDDEITDMYMRINEKNRLGLQYEWLARFAKQFSINDLEIGMIFAPPGTASSILRSHLEKSEGSMGETKWILRKDEMDTDMSMFRYFSFPLIETTKLEMREIAERKGFAGIMDSTWFCHRPINGKPCGFCHPCCIAMKMGMDQRLPRISKFRFYLYRAIRGLVRK